MNEHDTIYRQAAIDEIRKCRFVVDAIEKIRGLPSAQPTVADCWGCNCPKMERLKEQKTFSEMVHLHDTETHDKRTKTHACDLVSRQAALDALEWKWAGKAAFDAIKNLPSAQPEQRWTPCSERLPEDLEEVNVTWVNHIPEPYYDFLKHKQFTGSAVYYRGEWFWYSSRCVDILAEYGVNDMDKVDDGVEITAWMPLPEPYAER